MSRGRQNGSVLILKPQLGHVVGTSAVSEGKPHKKEWRAMEISSVTCGELMAVKRQQSLK